MNLRYVVPALAVCAFSAPALAADREVVTISGWSDNILTIGDDDFSNDTAGTPRNEGDTGLGFSTTASLKVGWTVTSRLRAKINVWFDNVSSTSSVDNALQLRESFFIYDLGGNLSWTMGKYINHVGWIAVERTGLYKVRASNIGYQDFFYGNDVVGTAIAYASKDGPLSGSFHLVNGYFNGADTLNRTTTGTGGRENWDLGYGADVIWAFGKNGSNVNLEFVYDPHAGSNSGLGTRPGSVFQTGLNATYRDIKDLTLGGEVIYRNTTTAKDEAGGAIVQLPGTHRQDFGWMLLANYGIGEGSGMGWFSFPASTTLSVQTVNSNWRAGGGGEVDTQEIALALLTNPLDNTNFGLNAEIALASRTAGSAPGTDNAVIFALEGIAVIP